MRRALIIAALASLACSRSDSAIKEPGNVSDSVVTTVPVKRDSVVDSLKTCGVTGTPMLTEQGLGDLRQGRSVSEVSALCEVLSDSPQRGVEGMMERVLVVRIAGEPVRSIVTNDRIFRIEINTPRFRTADSLGVDTPLRRIASMRGAQFAPGEDGVYGFSGDHCGLSFRFSLPWRPPAGGQWTARAITAEHGDAAVNRVIVIECRR